MIEMFKKVVFENYANFNGRARRREYWMFNLLTILIYMALLVFYFIPAIGTVFSILVGIFLLGIIIPSIAVGVRRMHDIGKSGWFILIPYYNLYLCCIDGEKGPNQYGADPKNQLEEISEIGKE